MSTRKRYVLGDFLLDPDSRRLTLDGKPVHLARLPFQVLLYLVEHHDRVVTRDELLTKFWDGKDVYGDTLRKCVGTIRGALKDGEQSTFIETRHGQGYRYIGPLRELVSEASPPEPLIGKVPEVRLVIEGETRDVLEIQLSPARDQTVKLLQPARPKLPRPYKAALTVVAVCVLATPLFLIFRKSTVPSTGLSPGPGIHSIAVLPLKNLSNDPEQEYFSDGVTESLIAELTGIRDLKVIARNSAFTFKGKEVDVREIGQRLGVATVLEGSIRREAETVRVNVRLVNVEDRRVIWTGDTTRPLKDIVNVQGEIGCSVAESLKAVLCRDPDRKRGTNSLAAYDAYLKARDRRYKGDPKQAAEFYQQSINADPDYALGWAGLAEAYAVMETNSMVPPRSMTQRAKECAFKAIALDDTLAAPYAALGLLTAFSDRDWTAGESHFQRALAINPNYAIAHAWYAGTLLAQGKFAEAEGEYLRAQELDPLHSGIANNLAETYYYWRQPERCLKQVEKVFDLSPGNGWGYQNQTRCYLMLGRQEEAWQAAQKSDHAAFWKVIKLGRTGPEAAARRAAANLAQSEYGKTSPYGVAEMYAQMGDKEAAFAWLQKAADHGQADLVSLKIAPMFDPLRPDPRFTELLRRVGLPN